LLKDTFVTKGSLVKICGSSSFSNTPWLATGLFIFLWVAWSSQVIVHMVWPARIEYSV
jgi:hypothetical protein